MFIECLLSARHRELRSSSRNRGDSEFTGFFQIKVLWGEINREKGATGVYGVEEE